MSGYKTEQAEAWVLAHLVGHVVCPSPTAEEEGVVGDVEEEDGPQRGRTARGRLAPPGTIRNRAATGRRGILSRQRRGGNCWGERNPRGFVRVQVRLIWRGGLQPRRQASTSTLPAGVREERGGDLSTVERRRVPSLGSESGGQERSRVPLRWKGSSRAAALRACWAGPPEGLGAEEGKAAGLFPFTKNRKACKDFLGINTSVKFTQKYVELFLYYS